LNPRDPTVTLAAEVKRLEATVARGGGRQGIRAWGIRIQEDGDIDE
jgi:hypothetical protein